MTNGNNERISTTALQSRIRMFQATQRPIELHGQWVETKFGRCLVEGRLGQRHADLLSAILYNAQMKRDTDDGGMEILIDPAVIRRKMSATQFSFSQFETLLKELMQAIITLETPNFKVAVGHLIDQYSRTKNIKVYDPRTKGMRPLMKMRLGEVMTTMYKADVHLFYDPEKLVNIKHGISQAVARYILSHASEPNGGWKLDETILQVAGMCNANQLRQHRLRIKQDAIALKHAGILFDGENQRLHRIDTVDMADE